MHDKTEYDQNFWEQQWSETLRENSDNVARSGEI
jgi:hypothetical protein